ncbi:MAG: ATP-binding protein [Desulfoplanes sp.]|nr:ATP-binding protein [Desulfoplanes sp.]MDD4649053.1 ATP-binding protein [Desulfoplanes sp.]
MKGLPIKIKFTLWYLAVLSLILTVLGTGIYAAMSSRLHSSFDDSLKKRADQIVDFKDIIPIVAGGAFEEETGELISFYFYFDHALVNVSHRQIEIPAGEECINAVLGGENLYKTIELNNKPFTLYAVPYSPEPKRIMLDKFNIDPNNGAGRKKVRFTNPKLPDEIEIEKAVLIVARSTKDLDRALTTLFHILLYSLPITLFLSGWGGIFLLNRILRPIDDISQTTRKIEETDLTQRIKVTADDELGHLAQTINQMLSRLEKAFTRQKQLTSDASHELRGPIAVIQAEASLSLQKKRQAQSYRTSIEVIATAAERMSGIIKQLLFLARTDSSSQSLSFKSIDVHLLVSNLCDELDVLCQDKGLNLRYTSKGTVLIEGDESLLRTLFINLLTNAIRYTPVGGHINVDVSIENNMAVITFQDTGIGIPPKDVPYIFERFYRVDKARSRESGGSGLGLSIADQIVQVHHGRILVTSEMDTGSTFVVKLPVIS